ncbi:hypothetical protein JNO12_11785 [Erwinia aphidicola]|nr:hypothetical protein [Erwinia aphidicola]
MNPAWNTPVISFEDYLAYSEGGESCIAIYPEVVQGNPLNAPVVVRYMLNREGVIEKKAMNAKGGGSLLLVPFRICRQGFCTRYA